MIKIMYIYIIRLLLKIKKVRNFNYEKINKINLVTTLLQIYFIFINKQ